MRFITTAQPRKINILGYPKGLDTQTANDFLDRDQLVYATDTRNTTTGRQGTRKGAGFLSVPAGEAVDGSVTSTTGQAWVEVGTATWIAAKFTAGATKRATKAEFLTRLGTGTGPLVIQLHSDSAGAPGVVIGTSTIPTSELLNEAYHACRFIEAPLLTSGTSYWLSAHIQDNGSGHYEVASNTSDTSAVISADGGRTWTGTGTQFNFKVSTSTPGGVLGHFHARKSDGTEVPLLAYKESGGTTAVAKVNTNGTLTDIKTGLSLSATRYEFAQALDTVYYVNGYDAPRKWDFTTESAMSGTPAISKLIAFHADKLFFARADDTRIFWSNPGLFETFDSVDFWSIPTSKSPDVITKLVPFNNRNLVIFTSGLEDGKWVLSGTDISTMSLNKAMGKKGCVAPDSIQVTQQYIYFAGNDAVYRWNGSVDEIVARNPKSGEFVIANDYRSAVNRENMGSGLSDDHYYLFYTPAGEANNSRCWVFNTVLNTVESVDTACQIQKCLTRNGTASSGQFVQASNLVGALYLGEYGYSQLGKPLLWEIRGAYTHYGAPDQEKEIVFFKPRFTPTGTRVTIGIDTEFSDSPTETTISLTPPGYIYGDGLSYGENVVYGSSNAPIRTDISLPAMAYYIQYRFRRLAADDPIEYIGQAEEYYLAEAL